MVALAAGKLTADPATQAHLASCEACCALLAETARLVEDRARDSDTAATLDVGDATRELDAPAATLAEGAEVGRFVIERVIGRGGMGVVYEARDRDLHRKVAIKVLAEDLAAHADQQQRLLREARAMAQLSHPNVVSVYEVGITGGGLVFVAMELVDGTTLRQWMRREPRPTWREAVPLFLEAGAGLAAAHAAGIVHRDFKPENVMIGRDQRVRVGDFGLAREPDQSTTPSPIPRVLPTTPLTRLTATGALAGTPAYMAPEQLHGNLADLGSDQFSFCVGLYEALFGERPFPGRSAVELARAMDLEVRPPRAPAVPRAIVDVVLRGLRRDPDERYPAMSELLDALRAAYDRAAHARGKRLARMAAAIVGVGAAAGAVFAFASARGAASGTDTGSAGPPGAAIPVTAPAATSAGPPPSLPAKEPAPEPPKDPTPAVEPPRPNAAATVGSRSPPPAPSPSRPGRKHHATTTPHPKASALGDNIPPMTP
jgi:tRNA A-37 threonylcarbamoyl transferase component Bud32